MCAAEKSNFPFKKLTPKKGILMVKRVLSIFIISTMFQLTLAQSTGETITFQSANPFDFRDVITIRFNISERGLHVVLVNNLASPRRGV